MKIIREDARVGIGDSLPKVGQFKLWHQWIYIIIQVPFNLFLDTHTSSFVRITALGLYEPRIKTRVDLIIYHITEANQPIDITAWANYLAFDIMGDVGFSKEFGCVANETEHPAIQSIHEHLAVIGIIGHIPWLLYLAARIPGAAAAYSDFFNWCGDEMEAKIKVSGTGSRNLYPQPRIFIFWSIILTNTINCVVMEPGAISTGYCAMAGQGIL